MTEIGRLLPIESEYNSAVYKMCKFRALSLQTRYTASCKASFQFEFTNGLIRRTGTLALSLPTFQWWYRGPAVTS